eukprot:3345702-Pyramimonas_sp.AAC.1
MGLNVGVPLDKNMGWDATTKRGQRMYDQQILNDEPYFSVVAHPCSPWANWSRLNVSRNDHELAKRIAKTREAHRPILTKVNQSVIRR